MSKTIKIHSDKPAIKAMAFAGCSFTWGQGVWYYSALDKLPDDPMYGYDPSSLNAVHHAFRQKWRWASQVASHFNTVAITHYNNGGANDQIIEFWKKSFESKTPRPTKSFNKLRKVEDTQPINYSDVSHFVFQFTQWMRSSFPINVNGVIKQLDSFDTGDRNHPEYQVAFEKFIESYDPGLPAGENKVGHFHEYIIKRDVEQVKEFLQDLESRGIKTYVLCWPWDHIKHIKSDPWLAERFITFDYNGKNYESMEKMIIDEENMSIEKDFEFFEVTPTDGHPSLKCNTVIAENVIKFMEKTNG